MLSDERLILIYFLAEHGINAYTFTDEEIRQQAQRIQSEQKLKSYGYILTKGKSKKKQPMGKNPVATKKIPDK